jgi:hypothetical protein
VLLNKPTAEVHPGHKLTGPKEEEEEEEEKEKEEEEEGKKKKKEKKKKKYSCYRRFNAALSPPIVYQNVLGVCNVTAIKTALVNCYGGR